MEYEVMHINGKPYVEFGLLIEMQEELDKLRKINEDHRKLNGKLREECNKIDKALEFINKKTKGYWTTCDMSVVWNIERILKGEKQKEFLKEEIACEIVTIYKLKGDDKNEKQDV